MRRDDQPIKENSEAVGFIFHFQITNGAGRKACCIRVEATITMTQRSFFARTGRRSN
jgi:hypothetical protein